MANYGNDGRCTPVPVMTDAKLANRIDADEIGMFAKRREALEITIQLGSIIDSAQKLVQEADVILKYLTHGTDQKEPK